MFHMPMSSPQMTRMFGCFSAGINPPFGVQLDGLIIMPGILIQSFPGTVGAALTTKKFSRLGQLSRGHDIS